MNRRIKFVKYFIDKIEKYTFDKKIAKYYMEIKKDVSCLIDVGSNVGQSIDIFSKLFSGCDIYSIEANPKCYNELLNNYKSKSYIHFFNIGISDVDAKKKFYVNVLDTTSTFEDVNQESEHLKLKKKVLGVSNIIDEVIDVDVLTLDTFMNENKLHNVNFIKIDTEGHEFSCLKGLFVAPKAHLPKYIQIELHFDDMYSNQNADIENLLKSNNYKVFCSVKHSFGKFEDRIYKLNS